MVAATSESTTKSPQLVGLLAEYRDQHELVQAAEKMHQCGYDHLDAFTPFPVHGMDHAIGIKPSPLPWLVLTAGVVGGIAALAFQWWANAIDYPYLISGKPLFSLPANIPITFEVVILAAAFVAFFGMLAINGLPKLANPLFRIDRFRRATSDGFFLFVAANEEQFEAEETGKTLTETGAVFVEPLTNEEESQRLPKGLVLVGIVLFAFCLIPPLIVATARGTKSDKPRFHNFFDMDFQPKFKSQTSSKLFADGRAMRPRVRGTIPRGQLRTDSRFLLGIEPSGEGSGKFATPAGKSGVESDPSAEPDWVTEIPMEVTAELMERGRERFNIHCAVCHGRAGQGNGLASLRALELQQGTWVPPTSVHAEYVREQPVGQLFNTISNGVRKMPAYGHQIPPKDRWAIVLYLRALQRSQYATISDVPEGLRTTLREMN